MVILTETFLEFTHYNYPGLYDWNVRIFTIEYLSYANFHFYLRISITAVCLGSLYLTKRYD